MAKTTFKNRAERQNAVQQATEQRDRAIKTARGAVYNNSQYEAYRSANPNDRMESYADDADAVEAVRRGGQFARNKQRTREAQIKQAYANRMSAITTAGISG